MAACTGVSGFTPTQPSVAATYHVDAMPTQLIINPDGSVVAKRVGYSNPGDFYAFVNGALGI